MNYIHKINIQKYAKITVEILVFLDYFGYICKKPKYLQYYLKN